jgi:hypothetical protein
MANELTFRDFAAAAMAGKQDDAARVLGELLALDAPAATAATARFSDQMKTGGQAFMMKAMGLRQAVGSPDDAALRAVLADCFGLDGAPLDGAVAALRARYR